MGKSRPDACHSAITESETDSLKRALRLLGGSLGQQLYRKQGNLGEIPGRLTPPENLSDVMAEYVDKIGALETMEAMQELVSTIRLESDLSHDERIELRVRLQMKYNEMKGSQDA
jgi:recombination DNA repair RAD52 pathway protein